MSEETAKPKLPQQWRVESVKTTEVSVNCPACHKHFSFDIGAFEKKPIQKIEGLTKTDQVVRRTYGQNFLAFVAALIVYYYAHQWVNGEGTPLNQGILIPVFIAVFAYSILKPFFSAGLFGGRGIPIHVYKCDQCQSDVFVACDGKSLAYPVIEETKAEPQAREQMSSTAPVTTESATQTMPTDVPVNADVMKTRFLEAGSVCWYCQKNKPANGKPHNTVVQRKEGNDWIRKTVWVPRCNDCEAVHKRQSPLFKTVLPVAIVALIVLCILIGGLGSGSLGVWAWILGIILSLAGTVGAITLIQKTVQQQADAAGTRAESLANSEYPQVAELIKQGWQIDTTNTGKTA